MVFCFIKLQVLAGLNLFCLTDIYLNLERKAGFEPTSLLKNRNVNLMAFFIDKKYKVTLGFSQLNYFRIKSSELCRNRTCKRGCPSFQIRCKPTGIPIGQFLIGRNNPCVYQFRQQLIIQRAVQDSNLYLFIISENVNLMAFP